MAKKDYYDVLGVSRGADDDQIKKAYRRLARKYHPDVSKDTNAAEKFKEVQEAYQVLSDKNKRAAYDQFGHAGAGMGSGIPGGPWAHSPGGSRTYYSTGAGRSAGFDVNDFSDFDLGGGGRLQDVLDGLFGRSTARQTRRRKPAAKGADVEDRVTIAFEQAIWGTTLRLQIDKHDDTGAVQKETIDVKVPPGVKDGARIRVKGKGQPSSRGPAGNLYIVVQVKPHAYFRRDGNDIYLDVPVTLSEAILGSKVTMPTIDGPTTVTIPPGTCSEQKLRLRNKGIPDAKTKQRGDQYAVIKVILPKQVDESLEDAINKLGQATGDPRKDLPWIL